MDRMLAATSVAMEAGADERLPASGLLQALQQAEERLAASADSPGNERLQALCRQLGELHRTGLAPQVGQLARELAASGHIEPARGLWLALQQALPDSPAGWVGQAKLATQQHRWEEAMEGWSRALERFPDRNQPVWKLGLARAMHHLGLNDEAAGFLRQALSINPDVLGVRHLLVNVLDKTGHLADALALLEERLDDCLGDLHLQFQHLKLLTRLGQRERAVATAHRLLDEASSLDWLPGIVRMLPEMAEAHALAQLTEHARARLDEFAEGATPGRPRQLACELALRLLLLQRRHDAFVQAFGELAPIDLPPRQHGAYRRLAERLATPLHELIAAPKVFCIGLSKTATTSFTAATEALGLFSAHYQHPLSFEMLDEQQALYFDACSDTPIAASFERLYHQFPNARFVLTQRPKTSWLASLQRHHQLHFGTSDWAALRQLTAQSLPRPALVEASLYFRHADADAAWQAHEQRVSGFFADKPPGKLLVLDVFAGQGWPELCGFLGLAAPAARFPHENPVREGG